MRQHSVCRYSRFGGTTGREVAHDNGHTHLAGIGDGAGGMDGFGLHLHEVAHQIDALFGNVEGVDIA